MYRDISGDFKSPKTQIKHRITVLAGSLLYVVRACKYLLHRCDLLCS